MNSPQFKNFKLREHQLVHFTGSYYKIILAKWEKLRILSFKPLIVLLQWSSVILLMQHLITLKKLSEDLTSTSCRIICVLSLKGLNNTAIIFNSFKNWKSQYIADSVMIISYWATKLELSELGTNFQAAPRIIILHLSLDYKEWKKLKELSRIPVF